MFRAASLPVFALTLTAVAVPTVDLLAQNTPSVLALDATYRFAELGTDIGPLPSQHSIYASSGTVELRPDLTLFAVTDFREIFATGAPVNLTDVDVGTYAVTPDSRVELDLDAANPGTDLMEAFVDVDGDYLVTTRFATETESFLSLGLRTSSGHSAASLTGDYRIVETLFRLDAFGISTDSAVGTIQFDGSGGWSSSTIEQNVDPSGMSSGGSTSDSGTYAIAADGELTVDGTRLGAISPGGDVFFFLTTDAATDEVALTTGVRIATVLDTATLAARDWGFAVQQVELGPSAGSFPFVVTQAGTLDLTATSANTGTVSGTGFLVENDPGSLVGSTDSFMGTFTVLSLGRVRLADPAGGQLAELFVAPDHDFFISTNQNGTSDLILGVRRCAASGAYGNATAGTGGVAPQLGMQGFPIAGAPAGFALRIVDAPAGAPCALPLSLGAGPGIPFLGGTLWFDPTPILTTVPLTADGTGEALLPLSIPAGSTLIDVPLFGQALVLDPGAPAGLAMSAGFRFVFCR